MSLGEDLTKEVRKIFKDTWTPGVSSETFHIQRAFKAVFGTVSMELINDKPYLNRIC